MTSVFRRVLFRGTVLGLLLGAAGFGGVARAGGGDAETRTVARELARHGAEAFDQKDFTTALDRFTRAEALFRAPSIVVMRARALAALGRLVEALDAYEETQRMPLGGNAPSAFREAVQDAEREGEGLRKRVPRLTIRVRVEDGLDEGMRVLLDGKAVPDALLNVDRPVDPGTHEIAADAPGHASVTRSATLREGDRMAIEIVLGGGPASVEVAKETPGAPPSGSSPFLGWIFVGAGVAGIGVSAVTGVMALRDKSSLDSECRPGCPASAASDIDSFRTNRTVSYVSVGVGLASLGVGGYLLLSGRGESAHVAASIGPRALLISGSF
jgi:hypothetical protein